MGGLQHILVVDARTGPGSIVKRWASALGVFVAVTLLAPLAAGAVMVVKAAGESPLESALKAAPLIAKVESATRSGEAQVKLSVAYADALAPRTHASGILTSTNVAVGDEVAGGKVVGTINGASLVAYQSARPLWQDVATGSPADLVTEAQVVLKGLGYYSGAADGKFATATRNAVMAFNLKSGYGKNNQVLALAALVWIGPDPIRVAGLSVQAGDDVGPGAELFTTTAALTGIKVTEPPGLVKSAAYQLDFGTTSAPYQPGTGLVTEPQAVAVMVRDMGTLTESAGTLRLVKPLVVGAVPSSAIVTDPSGAMCMFSAVTGPATKVTPLSGSLGTVDLDAKLAGTDVLVNPREVRSDLSCG